MSKVRRRPREAEQRDVSADGIAWYMLDDDGFVLPRFREHVASLRRRPEMSDIGEVMHVATARNKPED